MLHDIGYMIGRNTDNHALEGAKQAASILKLLNLYHINYLYRRNNMLIRPIQPCDFEGIHKLVCQVHALHVANRPDIYETIDPFDTAYFDFLLSDPNTLAFVTVLEDEVVGFCVVTLRPPTKNPIMKRRKVAWMEDLCIDERHRHLGLGKNLFDAAQSSVQERGYDVLELMVWSFNESAIKFYEHMGMHSRSIIMEQKI